MPSLCSAFVSGVCAEVGLSSAFKAVEIKTNNSNNICGDIQLTLTSLGKGLTGDAHTATTARELREATHMPAMEDQVTPAEGNARKSPLPMEVDAVEQPTQYVQKRYCNS